MLTIESKSRGAQSQHASGFVMLEFLLSLSLLLISVGISMSNIEQVSVVMRAARARHDAFCLAQDTVEQVCAGAPIVGSAQKQGFTITTTIRACCECAQYRYVMVRVIGHRVEVDVCVGMRQ